MLNSPLGSVPTTESRSSPAQCTFPTCFVDQSSLYSYLSTRMILIQPSRDISETCSNAPVLDSLLTTIEKDGRVCS